MVRIREVMKKNVITADPNLSVADVTKIMTNNRVGSVVLMSNNKPRGIVTDSDVVTIVARGMDPKKVKIKDVPKKRKSFIYTGPDESVMAVAKKMLKSGVKRVPVIENGKLMGMVSDKEILLISPELINILSERLKIRVGRVADPTREIAGICENCEAYSDTLVNIDGRWVCESCR